MSRLAMYALAAILALAASFGAGHHVGAEAGKVKVAQVTAANAKAAQRVAELTTKASEAARRAEQTQAVAFASIAQQNEQDKIDAKAYSDRVIADLHTGALRLRDRWATQSLSQQAGVAASTSAPDAVADDRAASAGRIVRAARDADDQIRGLQEVLRVERSH